MQGEDDINYLVSEFKNAKNFFTNGVGGLKLTLPSGDTMPAGKVRTRICHTRCDRQSRASHRHPTVPTRACVQTFTEMGVKNKDVIKCNV